MAIVALSFPELFTGYERAAAEKDHSQYLA